MKIGWIDFSQEDRDKALEIMDLLKKEKAVDELGIGVIRDRLADLLFPGTSTIQTRAKYFYIVPWCFMECEKKKYKNKQGFKKKLDSIEIEVIERLLKKDEEQSGIIGKNSKEKLKRKASSIYWNGIKKYGIINTELSLDGYIDALDSKFRRSKLERIEGDDLDSIDSVEYDIKWNTIECKENWLENIEIELTREEAIDLRDKIIRNYPDSLYANILINHMENIEEEEDIYDLSFEGEIPEKIYKVYKIAIDFGKLIHGAHIRFNIILNNKNNIFENEYLDCWNEWVEMVSKFEWNTFDEEEFFIKTEIKERDRGFIKDWFEVCRNIKNVNLEYVDDLISNREILMKKGRSKIRDYENVDITKWIGLKELIYRWNIVRQLIMDIKEGINKDD